MVRSALARHSPQPQDPDVLRVKARLVDALEVLTPSLDLLKAGGYTYTVSVIDAQGTVTLTVQITVRP
jgi:hypothetical protein